MEDRDKQPDGRNGGASDLQSSLQDEIEHRGEGMVKRTEWDS